MAPDRIRPEISNGGAPSPVAPVFDRPGWGRQLNLGIRKLTPDDGLGFSGTTTVSLAPTWLPFTPRSSTGARYRRENTSVGIPKAGAYPPDLSGLQPQKRWFSPYPTRVVPRNGVGARGPLALNLTVCTSHEGIGLVLLLAFRGGQGVRAPSSPLSRNIRGNLQLRAQDLREDIFTADCLTTFTPAACKGSGLATSDHITRELRFPILTSSAVRILLISMVLVSPLSARFRTLILSLSGTHSRGPGTLITQCSC